MSHLDIRTLEDAGRATAVWSNEAYDAPSRFSEIARSLLPATLILATATALLLALL